MPWSLCRWKTFGLTKLELCKIGSVHQFKNTLDLDGNISGQ
jgi:hypothetical protein